MIEEEKVDAEDCNRSVEIKSRKQISDADIFNDNVEGEVVGKKLRMTKKILGRSKTVGLNEAN